MRSEADIDQLELLDNCAFSILEKRDIRNESVSEPLATSSAHKLNGTTCTNSHKHSQTSTSDFQSIDKTVITTLNVSQPQTQPTSDAMVETDACTALEIKNEPSLHSKKRKLKGIDEWKQNKRRILRENGLAYLSPQGVTIPAKTMQPRCSCNAKRFQCSEITEEERKDIFKYIWQLTWSEKRNFIKGLLEVCEPKRRYSKREKIYRKDFTWNYYLTKNNRNIRVCKAMFMSTTGLTQHCVRSAMNDEPSKASFRPSNPHYERGKDAKDKASEFLDQLRKLPSHHCCKGSSKLYLEPRFKTLTNVHHLYSSECGAKQTNVLGITAFKELLEHKNISLFKRKKDGCDVCMAHENGNIDDDVWTTHMDNKKSAEKEQTKHKFNAVDPDIRVMS